MRVLIILYVFILGCAKTIIVEKPVEKIVYVNKCEDLFYETDTRFNSYIVQYEELRYDKTAREIFDKLKKTNPLIAVRLVYADELLYEFAKRLSYANYNCKK